MLRVLLALGCAFLAQVVPLAAQPASLSSRFELWAGFTIVAPRTDSSFTTSFLPVIDRYSPSPQGTAGQSARLQSSNGSGFEAGANFFFSEHVGAQVFVDLDRFEVEGSPGAYTVAVTYTASLPPDYIARTYPYSRTDTPCAGSPTDACVQPTTGRFRQLTLGFDALGRWALGRRVNGELVAGLAYFNLRGDAQPLRYTLFEMGGHSTLFTQEYQLTYSVGPARGLGFNAGGSVDIELTPGVAIVADARYFNGPTLTADILVTGVLNKTSLAFLQEPATIQQILHPPAVSLNPARSRIMVGVKVRR